MRVSKIALFGTTPAQVTHRLVDPVIEVRILVSLVELPPVWLSVQVSVSRFDTA